MASIEPTQSTSADQVDPGLRFKYDSSDPAIVADPWPYYKALLTGPPLIAERRGVPWAIVSRYHEAVEVLRDHKRFSSVNPQLPGTEDFDAFKGIPVMTFSDPPVHTRLRRVAAPSLSVRRMNDTEPQFRAMCGEILREWEGRSEIDVVKKLSVDLPIRVFGHLLGIPQSDYGIVRALGGGGGGDGGSYGSEEYDARRGTYIAELVEKRRRESGGQDLISLAIAAHDVGEKINSIELFGMVMVLVTGGIATTADLITGTLFQLGRRPDLLEQVRRDLSLVPAALEETLRYDGPIHTLFRVTIGDVEVGGTMIKDRTPVYVVTGASNRDPAAFKDPDVFDITRDPNDHLGFGEGVHFCIGAAPARVQAKVAVQMALERFPRLRLVPGWTPKYHGNPFGRGLSELPLLID